MKLFFLATASLLVTSTVAQSMSDADFFRAAFYDTYNGFARGFYREHRQEVVSSQCLGEWVA